MITQGQEIMVFVGGKSIAFATSHSLNVSVETKETATKDNEGKWTTAEAGIMSWTASSENMLADTGAGKTYHDLFALMITREPVDLILAHHNDGNYSSANELISVPTGGWTPSISAGKYGYQGKALITALNQSNPNNDNATFTVDFTGVGPLKEVTTYTAPASAASLMDED